MEIELRCKKTKVVRQKGGSSRNYGITDRTKPAQSSWLVAHSLSILSIPFENNGLQTTVNGHTTADQMLKLITTLLVYIKNFSVFCKNAVLHINYRYLIDFHYKNTKKTIDIHTFYLKKI